jgi:hypothetical protein
LNQLFNSGFPLRLEYFFAPLLANNPARSISRKTQSRPEAAKNSNWASRESQIFARRGTIGLNQKSQI